MTRYNSEANEAYVGMEEEYIPPEQLDGYQEGVDRVLGYIVSIHRYEGLVKELHWAIREGII